MKKIVLFLLLTANFIACKRNANFTDKKTEKEEFTITNSKKEISFDDLEEVSLPFCIKGSYVKDDLYYVDIDKFLGFHKLKKSLNKEVNALFHKGTIDFLTYKDNPFYELIPYRQNEFDTPPFATKKIQISDSITSILYAYIIEDGEPLFVTNEYPFPYLLKSFSLLIAFCKATKKSIDTSLFEMLSMDFNSKKKFVS